MFIVLQSSIFGLQVFVFLAVAVGLHFAGYLARIFVGEGNILISCFLFGLTNGRMFVTKYFLGFPIPASGLQIKISMDGDYRDKLCIVGSFMLATRMTGVECANTKV